MNMSWRTVGGKRNCTPRLKCRGEMTHRVIMNGTRHDKIEGIEKQN